MTRPGSDGTPPPGHDFGEFLRHALHTAGDQVEPGQDGLERIRARVRSGPAYASKHAGATGAHGGFLPDMRRRWNAWRDGSPAHGSGGRGAEPGHARPQPRDWRVGLLRSGLAAACAVFAIGVALAVPPLRQAFVQLGSAVGFASSHSSSSNNSGAQGTDGAGQQIGTPAGSPSPSNFPSSSSSQAKSQPRSAGTYPSRNRSTLCRVMPRLST